MAGAAIGAVGGAGLGLIKHNQEKGDYNRQKQLAADMERNSAWTGVHGTMPQQAPSMFNDVVSNAVAGGSMGAPGGLLGGAAPVDPLKQAMIGYYNRSGAEAPQAATPQQPQVANQSAWFQPKPTMYG